MESNNFLEQSLLNKIAEQMDTQVFAQAQANLKAPAITQPAPERSSSMATVSFASNPAGADIELGGRFIGSTPSKVDLPTGKHEVVIKKAGHRDWTRKLDLLPGANINLQAELTPGEMPVVALASPTAPALQPPLASEPSKPVPTKITAAPAKFEAPAVSTKVPRIVCPENIKEVPFSSSRPDRRKLACDEAITIVSESASWIRVKTSDGIEGNVAAKFVEK
jgi:hypothetical protein